MKIIYKDNTALSSFNFKAEAMKKVNMLSTNELALIEDILSESYPDGIEATKLNDMFTYDFDMICEMLGIPNPLETEETDDELDDFEVNEEVCYEVWALGYSDNNEITDCEILLGEFSDFGEAINYAKNTVTLEVCLEQLAKENNVETFTEGVTYFCIEVQTVIPTADGGTENIDTAWHKIIEI